MKKKTKTINWFKIKPNLLSLIVMLTTTGSLFCLPAFSQIDYSYGLNKKGFRLGIGGGVSILTTHFNSNPLQPTFASSLDYAFSRYFTVGVESNFGKLKGVDDVSHLYYQSSTANYYSLVGNVKVSVGVFSDFEASNAWKDALNAFILARALVSLTGPSLYRLPAKG